LEKALAPGQWVDATHLVAKHGERVLQELKGAIQSLEELRKDKHSRMADEVVEGLIGRIVKAARLLAAVENAGGAKPSRTPFDRGR
jgi:hypothetical protein